MPPPQSQGRHPRRGSVLATLALKAHTYSFIKLQKQSRISTHRPACRWIFATQTQVCPSRHLPSHRQHSLTYLLLRPATAMEGPSGSANASFGHTPASTQVPAYPRRHPLPLTDTDTNAGSPARPPRRRPPRTHVVSVTPHPGAPAHEQPRRGRQPHRAPPPDRWQNMGVPPSRVRTPGEVVAEQGRCAHARPRQAPQRSQDLQMRRMVRVLHNPRRLTGLDSDAHRACFQQYLFRVREECAEALRESRAQVLVCEMVRAAASIVCAGQQSHVAWPCIAAMASIPGSIIGTNIRSHAER